MRPALHSMLLWHQIEPGCRPLILIDLPPPPLTALFCTLLATPSLPAHPRTPARSHPPTHPILYHFPNHFCNPLSIRPRTLARSHPPTHPQVYCKGSPATTFYLSFRPAATDDLDDQTVTLGVPAAVPQVRAPGVCGVNGKPIP